MRGLKVDGQQMWQAPISQYATPPGNAMMECCFTVPDSLGGSVIFSRSLNNSTQRYADALTRIDGATGLASWRYDAPPTNYYFAGTLDGGFAIHHDGTVYAVETVGTTPGSFS